MEKLKNWIRRIAALNIPLYASHASFFIALSVFPSLVLLMGLLRYTGLGVEYLTDLLEGFLPGALMPAVNQLVISTYRNASGTLASLSALVALWSASRGVHGILQALNVIYGVRDDRSWLHNRGLSVLYTFGFLVVLLLTLLMSVFGNVIILSVAKELSEMTKRLYAGDNLNAERVSVIVNLAKLCK